MAYYTWAPTASNSCITNFMPSKRESEQKQWKVGRNAVYRIYSDNKKTKVESGQRYIILNKVRQLGTRSTSDSNNLNMIKQSKTLRRRIRALDRVTIVEQSIGHAKTQNELLPNNVNHLKVYLQCFGRTNFGEIIINHYVPYTFNS